MSRRGVRERARQRDAEAAEAAQRRQEIFSKLREALKETPRKRYGGSVVTMLLGEIERLQGEIEAERKRLQNEASSEKRLRLSWERDHLRLAKKCDVLELELSARALPGSGLPIIDVEAKNKQGPS